MQLTLCDEFDLCALNRFIARIERPFVAPTARELLRHPIRRQILPDPQSPVHDPSFQEIEPERWDGLG